MPDDDDVIPMALCPHCEHFVPEANLALHEARCQGRKRPAQGTTNGNGNGNGNASGGNDEQLSDRDRATHRSLRRNRDSEREPFLPRASWEAPSRSSRNEITTIQDDEDDDEVDEMASDDLHDLTSLPPSAAAAASQQEVIDLVDDEPEHWGCPRCTLENESSSGRCEACGYRRPESERPADPVRRERLIDGPTAQFGGGGLIGGGALLGSVLGGTGAYLRGQSLSSGLLNGAMTGAVGGAVLNELARNDPRRANTVQQQQQTTFTSSAGSGPTMRTISIIRTPDGRLVTTQTSNGTSSTTVNDSTFRNAGNANPNAELNQLLTALLAQSLVRPGGRGLQHANTDQMSYEQLLQMFGTGTENLGAGEGQIRSLPSATIEDVGKLPIDSRQCAICLEDFKNGDERKIMPCLHGFHSDCVDKWLRTNGSCPICKNRLDR